ncbi:hypothetical protein HZB74_03555 [Candidatus Saccharibacteria bacterium]|nr:hypothetical protein [Candidatus Saccharibacteria bacterium]
MTGGLITSSFLLGSLLSPSSVYAADCNGLSGESKEICEASIKDSNCSDKDDAKAKACRKGFREGYRDPEKKVDEICDGLSGSEKSSCEDGVKKGRKAAEAKDGLGGSFTYNTSKGQYQCGNLSDDGSNFKTKFNFGCLGSKGPSGLNPILDLVFAFVRFLSTGVGIIIILALIMAGIQYSGSEGNPEASAKAKKRAQNALIGLIIYMFAWAILQFIVPGGVFK